MSFEFSRQNLNQIESDLVVVERLPGVVEPLPAGGGRGPLEDEQLPLRHPDVRGGEVPDAYDLRRYYSAVR